ncbi:MAG: ATP-binding cassette domain-containing protein [Gemmatales bacterium]
MPPEAAVVIDQVTKRFGAHIAVDNLSLNVPAGSIYGFIGPNGSGKTTTMRMIMRIIAPDAGHLKVLGVEKFEAANDRVSYLPEERGLYRQMKVRDQLRFFAEMKSTKVTDKEINDWLERMGLSEWAAKKVQTLSKGMAQKVQFIGTVISKPELVLLDEPFSGLDPVNAVVLRDAVLDLKKNGSTVIFSTHDMSVAEKMCDAIFMIYQGKKVLDGTLEAIQNQYGSDTIRVKGLDLNTTSIPGVSHVDDFGKYQELRLQAGADVKRILQHVSNTGTLSHFEIAKPSLQDIFMRIVGQGNLQTEQVGA